MGRFSTGLVRKNTSSSFAYAYRLGCVPHCVKNRTSAPVAGHALTPGSSSTLEIYAGIRARGLKWCITWGSIVSRPTCSYVSYIRGISLACGMLLNAASIAAAVLIG